jgi:hypothetical protein
MWQEIEILDEHSCMKAPDLHTAQRVYNYNHRYPHSAPDCAISNQ